MISLDDILELARAARRSPHGRQVLFDALIERYGTAVLDYVAAVQEVADRTGRPQMIFLAPARLVRAERIWSHMPPRPATIAMLDLAGFTALRSYDALDLARARWRTQATEQQLVTVKPRRRE